MIIVKVNNTEHSFPSTITLKKILEQLKISPNGIAIAINQNIITKSIWKNTSVQDKDDILIIKATQGG